MEGPDADSGSASAKERLIWDRRPPHKRWASRFDCAIPAISNELFVNLAAASRKRPTACASLSHVVRALGAPGPISTYVSGADIPCRLPAAN
jgi:hypothetical protein